MSEIARLLPSPAATYRLCMPTTAAKLKIGKMTTERGSHKHEVGVGFEFLIGN